MIFCRFIDTAEYVAEHLSRRLGDSSYAVAAVTGTLPPDERMARIAELAADPARRPVLVATDCLSEGVNLQEHFQAVVHYDLAWNPTRHEQREGRVDRFGQHARVVRAVTIYGADNGIDGIVLDVLLRKHEQIRKALGISVPVPDRSDDVVEAILEGLLLRDSQSEQLTLDIGLERRDDLHKEWESAAEKEREFFTKYRQAAIHPEEVARELDEMRASLGTASDVRGFAEEALRALRADVILTPDGFTAGTGALPDGLRDALVPGHREPLPFHADLPVKPREAYLDRTDPNVAAIARYVLESALDSVTLGRRPGPAGPPVRGHAHRRRGEADHAAARPVPVPPGAARPGRAAPARRRGRPGARLPGAARGGRMAASGRDRGACWPPCRPATSSPTRPSTSPSGPWPPWTRSDPHLDTVADSLAVKLRDDHIRVREAGGQRVRRQIAVRAQKPADILGVYVYLPGGAA